MKIAPEMLMKTKDRIPIECRPLRDVYEINWVIENPDTLLETNRMCAMAAYGDRGIASDSSHPEMLQQKKPVIR